MPTPGRFIPGNGPDWLNGGTRAWLNAGCDGIDPIEVVGVVDGGVDIVGLV